MGAAFTRAGHGASPNGAGERRYLAQPGKPITVAVRLDHLPGWHTYWINPGTGAPTKLAWTLPQGWNAGPVQWPTPIAIKNLLGEVAGNGFEGTLYLPVELQVPTDAAPGKVTIKVHARWLMCAEACIPGQGDGSLDLVVANTAPTFNKEVRSAIAKQPMPQHHSDWTAAAIRSGASVTLTITTPKSLKAPHFFSEDGLIRTDATQAVQTNDKTLTLTLAVSDKAPSTNTLLGLLAYTDETGIYRGAQIRVPLSSNH